MLEELKKKPSENEEKYIWRIGQAKESGLISVSWNEIADAINEQWRTDESEYRTESAYRKTYQQAKRFYEAGVFKQYNSDAYTRELREAKHELIKEKQKITDERTELRRILREQARNESFIDIVVNKISTVAPLKLNYKEKQITESDNDVICHLTDIHAGIHIDHWFNKFDTDVLKQRFDDYITQLFTIQKRHNSQNCYLVIGEIISGLIHETIRLENNENVIQQFINVSSLISDLVAEISKHFNDVYIYITPGNHSRVIADKNYSVRGENFDILLPHYLKASLQNYNNVHIMPNDKDCYVAMFNVRGNEVFAAHGDKDSPSDVVQNFTLMFGVKPDIILFGHRHTNGLFTVNDTKIIQSGCVSGSDDYCLDRRLKNKPEQTISVIDANGLVCLYDITLK